MIAASALFELVDAELERRAETRGGLYDALAARFGVTADAWYRRLRRAAAAGRVDLGLADQVLVVLDLSLDDLPGTSIDGPPVRDPRRFPTIVTDDQVQSCHVLYERLGLSALQVAEMVWERLGYANAPTCARQLQRHFARLGLPRRGQREATALRAAAGRRLARGSAHHNSGLTEEAVRFILGHLDMTNVELAARLGTTHSNVSKIRCGRAWRHVAEQMAAAA